MDKQAALQEIYNESFNDEIEKIARMPGGRTATKVFKYLQQAVTPMKNRQFGLSSKAYAKDAVNAAVAGARGGAKGVGSAYAESAKGLYGGAKESIQKTIASLGKAPQHPWNRDPRLAAQALRGEAGKAAWQGVRKGGLVLGTAGAVGSAGVAGAAITGRKNG